MKWVIACVLSFGAYALTADVFFPRGWPAAAYLSTWLLAFIAAAVLHGPVR